jgi:hypothetical protein
MPSEKKANHQVNIVRLGEPRVHANADSLELFDIGAFQVVTKKGEFHAGDLGMYIQPDSVVPQTEPFRFIWEAHQGLDGVVPEKRRRITVRKFRNEWSEGLLLPASVFPELIIPGTGFFSITEGDDVSELLGIEHYDPDKGKENASDSEVFKKKRSRYPKSLKGWWYLLLHKLGIYTSGGQNHGFDTEDGVDMPIYDVDALKHYKNAFEPGEMVEVTEKIHGSNARFIYREGHMYAGSHTQWKHANSNCIWRNVLKAQPWIEEWCRKNEGFGLYGEVTPTQGERFTYGSKDPQLFAFDIRTPDGTWMDREGGVPLGMAPKVTVPLLYEGPYDYDMIVKQYLDGQTTVPGATGMREGIVIRPLKERHIRGLGRLILKVVSNSFLEKDNKEKK